MAKDSDFDQPFDGAISRFADKEAPEGDPRARSKDADKDDILDPRYPYRKRLDDEDYDAAYDACQLELGQAADLVPRRPASASSWSSRAATPPARAARSRRSPRT